jgi:hypothetical protein
VAKYRKVKRKKIWVAVCISVIAIFFALFLIRSFFWKTYKNTDYNFEFTYPQNWNLRCGPTDNDEVDSSCELRSTNSNQNSLYLNYSLFEVGVWNKNETWAKTIDIYASFIKGDDQPPVQVKINNINGYYYSSKYYDSFLFESVGKFVLVKFIPVSKGVFNTLRFIR